MSLTFVGLCASTVNAADRCFTAWPHEAIAFDIDRPINSERLRDPAKQPAIISKLKPFEKPFYSRRLKR
jgi:hypothetical protein